MAQFDYAFLADFAKFDSSGTMTAVGISFTQLKVEQLPSMHVLSVAGRIRSTIEEQPTLTIKVHSPNRKTEISGEMHASNVGKLIPYDSNKVGILFAANIPTPLTENGLYEVQILLDGVEVRNLKFEVSSLNDLP